MHAHIFFTHTSAHRTLCWSLTLLYTVVMETPLREDTQAATLVKSACYTSLSLFLSHTHAHTRTPSFSFTASHFYLSPSITFSSSPIVLLRLSLHHPCRTSLPVSLHYCATFSSSHLPPRTSPANVNMPSHFSNPHRVCISDLCLVSTHTF